MTPVINLSPVDLGSQEKSADSMKTKIIGDIYQNYCSGKVEQLAILTNRITALISICF